MTKPMTPATRNLDNIIEQMLYSKLIGSPSEPARSNHDVFRSVGLAIAVVQGTDATYTRCFGVKEFGAAQPIDGDTLFQVGSTTKAFTAAALGMLFDAGQIDWDDPIIKYVPEFRVADPMLASRITIRDAITHRSGLDDRSYLPYLAIMDANAAVSQLRYARADGEFRGSYRYSNLLYAIAGKVIEAVSGVTWREFVKRSILLPLNMNRSGTSPYEFWDSQCVTPTFCGSAPADQSMLQTARNRNLAMPHGYAANASVAMLPWQSYDNAAAAGSLVSSARDMANWLIMNLNHGQFCGQQLLQQQTLVELHATQNPHVDGDSFPFECGTESYAMGWRRARYRGRSHLSHGGGMIGFPAYVALLPDELLGVVVLSNGPQVVRDRLGMNAYALHKAIASTIFDQLLDMPPVDWITEFAMKIDHAQRQTQAQEADLVQPRDHSADRSLTLGQYAGAYVCTEECSACVRVRVESEQLRLNFDGEGAYSAWLEHWNDHVFRVRSDVGGVADILGPQFLRFAVDEGGRVASMHAFGSSFCRDSDRASLISAAPGKPKP